MLGRSQSNKQVALILAIVPGLFGFLGLGQMYKRQWWTGVGLLVLGWFLLLITVASLLSSIGASALVFATPIMQLPLILNPDHPSWEEYGPVTFGIFAVGKWMFYGMAWAYSIYSAWTKWGSSKDEKRQA